MISFFAFHPQPTNQGRETENVAVGSSSAASTKCTLGSVYRLVASTNCYVRLSKAADTDSGANVATTADMLFVAGVPMVLLADNWDTVAVLQVTAAGILGITKVQNPV